MERDTETDQIPFGPDLFGMMHPGPGEFHQQVRVQDASDPNPRHIKQDGNEFDADANKTQIQDPRGESLFVEDPSSDEEPRVDLDDHASAHAPLVGRSVVWDENVQNGRQVVLDDGRRTLDARRDEENPYQIDAKVKERHSKEPVKPFSRPSGG